MPNQNKQRIPLPEIIIYIVTAWLLFLKVTGLIKMSWLVVFVPLICGILFSFFLYFHYQAMNKKKKGE